MRNCSAHSSQTLFDLSRRGPRSTSQAGVPEPLRGKRFLIVEDEPLIALDSVAALEGAGMNVEGLAGSVADALRAIEGDSFDGVLLDANLHGEPSGEVAAALIRRNIPFAFCNRLRTSRFA